MVTRLLLDAALGLLLAAATPANLTPALAQQASPGALAGANLQKDKGPRLPAGPLSGKVGHLLQVPVRKAPADTDAPFSLEAEVQEAPAGAKLEVSIESYNLFVEADKPGTYRIRVRGIKQVSVG